MDKLSILNRIFFLKLNEIYIDDIYDKNILLMIDKKIEFENADIKIGGLSIVFTEDICNDKLESHIH